MVKKIKVILVDDNASVRKLLKNFLSKELDIEIVAEAADPFDASEKIEQFEPDVMILDIEMPRMNGLEFLKQLMPQLPMRVIMFSGIDDNAAKIALTSMDYGAIDFITKPDGSADAFENTALELISKIRFSMGVNLDEWIHTREKNVKLIANKKFNSNVQTPYSSSAVTRYRMIAIGASTGGTHAIRQIISDLPTDFPGIVIVQHMPPGFTKIFSERLNEQFPVQVKEAQDGDQIRPGLVLIAPGDFHMVVLKSGLNLIVRIKHGEKVNGHKPSVDVLFNSIVDAGLSRQTIGCILTGMGADGAIGLTNMRRQGSRTLGQTKESCVVYGMPKVAYDMGGVDEQVGLKDFVWKIKTILYEKA